MAEKVFNEDPYTPEMAERFASAPPPEENPLLNNATVRGDEPQRETSMFKVLDEQYNKILTELRLLTSSIEDLKQKKRKLTEEFIQINDERTKYLEEEYQRSKNQPISDIINLD